MKETYYTLENNTLKKCGSVVKVNGRWVTNPTAEQYAAIGAYPRSDESFAPPACDEGFHAVADGYELHDGKWTRKWRIDVKPYEPPMPRTFSKMKVIIALNGMGVWQAVRDYIVAADLYDLFLAAQDFREDDPYFKQGLESLKAKLDMTDEQIEEILKQAEA